MLDEAAKKRKAPAVNITTKKPSKKKKKTDDKTPATSSNSADISVPPAPREISRKKPALDVDIVPPRQSTHRSVQRNASPGPSTEVHRTSPTREVWRQKLTQIDTPRNRVRQENASPGPSTQPTENILKTPILPSGSKKLPPVVIPGRLSARRVLQNPAVPPSPVEIHRTRSYTGVLASKKRKRSPDPEDDQTPPATVGLAKWLAGTAQKKRDVTLPENGSAKLKLILSPKKRIKSSDKKSKAASNEVIELSSDSENEARPAKRRRYSTQITPRPKAKVSSSTEVIDLCSDDDRAMPPPKSVPSRKIVGRTTSVPKPVAKLGTPISTESRKPRRSVRKVFADDVDNVLSTADDLPTVEVHGPSSSNKTSNIEHEAALPSTNSELEPEPEPQAAVDPPAPSPAPIEGPPPNTQDDFAILVFDPKAEHNRDAELQSAIQQSLELANETRETPDVTHDANHGEEDEELQQAIYDSLLMAEGVENNDVAVSTTAEDDQKEYPGAVQAAGKVDVPIPGQPEASPKPPSLQPVSANATPTPSPSRLQPLLDGIRHSTRRSARFRQDIDELSRRLSGRGRTSPSPGEGRRRNTSEDTTPAQCGINPERAIPEDKGVAGSNQDAAATEDTGKMDSNSGSMVFADSTVDTAEAYVAPPQPASTSRAPAPEAPASQDPSTPGFSYPPLPEPDEQEERELQDALFLSMSNVQPSLDLSRPADAASRTPAREVTPASPVPSIGSLDVYRQEQEDLEEALFQSMLEATVTDNVPSSSSAVDGAATAEELEEHQAGKNEPANPTLSDANEGGAEDPLPQQSQTDIISAPNGKPVAAEDSFTTDVKTVDEDADMYTSPTVEEGKEGSASNATVISGHPTREAHQEAPMRPHTRRMGALTPSAAPVSMDPIATDPNVLFIHPPFTVFPDSALYPDGLSYQLMAENPEWFLDANDFISEHNTNPNAVLYPPDLRPPRPAKKDLRKKGAEGQSEGDEQRIRCTFCRRSYTGSYGRQTWRRHIADKHKVAMSDRHDNSGLPRGRGSNDGNRQPPSKSPLRSHDDPVDLNAASLRNETHESTFTSVLPVVEDLEQRNSTNQVSEPLVPEIQQDELSLGIVLLSSNFSRPTDVGSRAPSPEPEMTLASPALSSEFLHAFRQEQDDLEEALFQSMLEATATDNVPSSSSVPDASATDSSKESEEHQPGKNEVADQTHGYPEETAGVSSVPDSEQASGMAVEPSFMPDIKMVDEDEDMYVSPDVVLPSSNLLHPANVGSRAPSPEPEVTTASPALSSDFLDAYRREEEDLEEALLQSMLEATATDNVLSSSSAVDDAAAAEELEAHQLRKNEVANPTLLHASESGAEDPIPQQYQTDVSSTPDEKPDPAGVATEDSSTADVTTVDKDKDIYMSFIAGERKAGAADNITAISEHSATSETCPEALPTPSKPRMASQELTPAATSFPRPYTSYGLPTSPYLDPSATDPNVFFIHPPFTVFPDSALHPDGLSYQLLAENPEWFLDAGDFISEHNINADAIPYPRDLEPPRGWCPAKKADLRDEGSEGWPEGEEPRLRCTFCRKTYAGVNARSMWRRHVLDKHKIAMSNRRDKNERPQSCVLKNENGQPSSPLGPRDSLIDLDAVPQSDESREPTFRPVLPVVEDPKPCNSIKNSNQVSGPPVPEIEQGESPPTQQEVERPHPPSRSHVPPPSPPSTPPHVQEPPTNVGVSADILEDSPLLRASTEAQTQSLNDHIATSDAPTALSTKCPIAAPNITQPNPPPFIPGRLTQRLFAQSFLPPKIPAATVADAVFSGVQERSQPTAVPEALGSTPVSPVKLTDDVEMEVVQELLAQDVLELTAGNHQESLGDSASRITTQLDEKTDDGVGQLLTAEALEKNPMLVETLNGSRLLMEILRGAQQQTPQTPTPARDEAESPSQLRPRTPGYEHDVQEPHPLPDISLQTSVPDDVEPTPQAQPQTPAVAESSEPEAPIVLESSAQSQLETLTQTELSQPLPPVVVESSPQLQPDQHNSSQSTSSSSESSLATLDDSPPPSTPTSSDPFDTSHFYIRSISPDDDDDLSPEVFNKILDIPTLPPPETDDDDDYLLSHCFDYPDLDVASS